MPTGFRGGARHAPDHDSVPARLQFFLKRPPLTIDTVELQEILEMAEDDKSVSPLDLKRGRFNQSWCACARFIRGQMLAVREIK